MTSEPPTAVRKGFTTFMTILVVTALCSHYGAMRTRTLTIRKIPDATLRALRAAAKSNRRSLNAELLGILARAAEASPEPGSQIARERATRYAAPALEGSGDADLDRGRLADVCRRHGIRYLGVFGSHARGEARTESDVDVVVDFEPGKTPGLGIVRVAEALRPVFGGRRVDLVTRRGLSPRVRERVLAEAKLLYAAR